MPQFYLKLKHIILQQVRNKTKKTERERKRLKSGLFQQEEEINEKIFAGPFT